MVFVIYFSSGRKATSDSAEWRLPRSMDPRLWAEAVGAYRRAIAGRGNAGQQPKESAILRSAIAQAEMCEAITAASSSHGNIEGKRAVGNPTGQTAEMTPEELRAQSAMARQFDSPDLKVKPQ